MATHKVVKHDEWLAARKKHLAKEKEFTRMRDQLSRERRNLPWELVDKHYTFQGERGWPRGRDPGDAVPEARPDRSRGPLVGTSADRCRTASHTRRPCARESPS